MVGPRGWAGSDGAGSGDIADEASGRAVAGTGGVGGDGGAQALFSYPRTIIFPIKPGCDQHDLELVMTGVLPTFAARAMRVTRVDRATTLCTVSGRYCPPRPAWVRFAAQALEGRGRTWRRRSAVERGPTGDSHLAARRTTIAVGGGATGTKSLAPRPHTP